MILAEKSLRRTRAAAAAAPAATIASRLTAPSDAPHFDDRAPLVAAAAAEQEGDDDHADAGDDQAGLAAPSATSVVASVTPRICGQLRLDVGAGDGSLTGGGTHLDRSTWHRRPVRPDRSAAVLRLIRTPSRFGAVRASHTSAAPRSRATNMIRYGTHDQSPAERVAGLGLQQTQAAETPRNSTPKPEQQRTEHAEADVAAELLQRHEGLLLEVRDDQVAELGDELRQRRGSVVRAGRRSLLSRRGRGRRRGGGRRGRRTGRHRLRRFHEVPDPTAAPVRERRPEGHRGTSPWSHRRGRSRRRPPPG